MRTVNRLVLLALCFASLAFAGGCGHKHHVMAKRAVQADPSVVGTVTVYTSLATGQADAYLEDFKAEYPNAKVDLVSAPATTTVARIIAEKRKPVADVVWHTPMSALYGATEASALAEYDYHPGQIDAVAPDWTDPDTPNKPVITGVDGRLIGFALNTAKAGGAVPKTFSDLTDSRYAGQIVMPDINTEAGWITVASMMSADDQGTWDYLDQLDKNVAYYTTDDTSSVDAVQNGSAAVAIGFDADIERAQNQGSGIQVVWPGLPEMSPYEIDADALVAKPNPSQIAKTFLDWAISDNAMQLYAKDTPITSVDEGAGLPNDYPSSVSQQLFENSDWGYMADNHASIVAQWMKRYGRKIRKS